MPKSKAASSRALQLDDSLGEAHAALGWVKGSYDWDFRGAEQEFRRAIELDPNSNNAHGMYALFLDSMGRVEEAAAEHQRAITIDPLSLIDNTNVADGYYAAGQFQKAIEQYRKTLELDPNFEVASFGLGHAYAQLGMWREAVEAWQKGQASAGNASTAERMAWAYTQGGYESALRVWLADVPAEAHAHYVPATNVALVYAPLKDKERTLQWLNKAYEQRDSSLVDTGTEPALDFLRSDRRFVNLLRRVGLPQAGFAQTNGSATETRQRNPQKFFRDKKNRSEETTKESLS